jgi:hypothetical protein
MRDFLFDDNNDGKMRIEIDDRESDTFIKKTIDEVTWPEVLKEFVFMLNGCGYIIDPVKAEKYIEQLKADNGVIK